MTTVPEFPCEGGCACGAIRYRLLEDPLGLHICHCTDCQCLTGSAFVMSMPIHRRSLELLQGEPTTFDFATTEGIRHLERGCPNCGSRVWSESRRIPDVFVLRAGTLDDTSWLEPTAHIWTRSAQPWVPIPKDALRFEKGPDDALELVRRWRSRPNAPARVGTLEEK